MCDHILKQLPDEISREIYGYLNPIKKACIRKHNGDIFNWCKLCGEKPKLISFRFFSDSEDDCDYIKCLKCFYYK